LSELVGWFTSSNGQEWCCKILDSPPPGGCGHKPTQWPKWPKHLGCSSTQRMCSICSHGLKGTILTYFYGGFSL
jgi:hypothetical protein